MGEWMYRSTFSLLRHWLEVSGQLHDPAALPPAKSSDTHWIGGWVSSRAGLDDVEKKKFLTPLALELRLLGRPARSQSLYRLRYLGYLHIQIYKSRSRDSSVGIATCYRLGGRDSIPGRGKSFFSKPTMSRPTLVSTKSPPQCLSGLFLRG
jgi:hypothetical protein